MATIQAIPESLSMHNAAQASLTHLSLPRLVLAYLINLRSRHLPQGRDVVIIVV